MLQRTRKEPSFEHIRQIWRSRLHPDRLGWLCGLACAALVLVIGWFLRGDGGLNTLFWAAVAFGVAWTVTFVAAASIYHIIDREIPIPTEQKDAPAGEENPEGAEAEGVAQGEYE
jgi:hypothetical protein